MMTKELLKGYGEKLKKVTDDKKFIISQIKSVYGENHVRYMIDYIDTHPRCTYSDVLLADINFINEYKRKKGVSAILGLVVGDALGVPVEFVSRAELKENPLSDMVGYGTHSQPKGTWSDDSSMVVATMEWFAEKGEEELDFSELMDKFSQWIMYGEYTPYGEMFDCGISTNRAILNYGRGICPTECGGKSEFDNGNGSLMRILPAAIWYESSLAFKATEQAEQIYNISALTHGHARSKAGCLLYSKLVADIINMPDEDKFAVLERSIGYYREFLTKEKDAEIVAEAEKYHRLWDVEAFRNLPEESIKSSGYIVDTLEAAIWCFLNTNSYKECVLKAVNLGDDTDTVGAVAGGLAGLYYGSEGIPTEWLECIPKKDWIIELAMGLV